MDANQSFQLTRIAPTPSGFLHLGNIFSFALTAAIAHNTNASILLRIDDMDRERVSRDYLDDIFETLHFMQIPWHSGPENTSRFEAEFSQRHRLGNYNKALQQLKEEGKIYACTCSRTKVMQDSVNGSYAGTCRHKHLPLDTPDACWRLFTNEEPIKVNTLKNGILETILPAEMHDLVVRKKDGFPAYQLTSLADDLHFDVDLVVRGDDLWPSTLAQLYLAKILRQKKFADTVFYHHPLLKSNGGNKLSKSAGDTSIQFLRKQGKTAAEIYGLIGRALNSATSVSSWEDLKPL